MESAEYKKQYDEYLARAEKALSQACERYLPEGSDVCRAARYSLLGGGKRIRAVLVLAVCDMLHGNAEAAEQFAAAVEMLHCYSLIHDDLPAWITTICAAASPLAIRRSANPPRCWPVTSC